MIHSQPFMFDVAKIDPIAIRIEMMMNKHGLGIVVPDMIMPKFEFEPFTEDDLIAMAHRSYWYKRANILKFRSIIRKHKLTQ